jgi:acetyl-CoA carboxylase carboxyl transferase subunit alpha
LGVVDEIVPEPLGGAHRAPDEMVAELKGRVLEAFGSLDGFDTDQLLARRYERIRAYGSLDEQPEAS